MRRHRPSWTTVSDDRILEFLAESGAGHNLRGIVNNLLADEETISYSTVKRRIPVLEENGFVTELPGEGSYYRITDRGRAYLAGDLDADQLGDENGTPEERSDS